MSEAEKIADVTWEDPPATRRRYDWDAIAAKLRDKPGEWAKVFEYDRTSTVNAIRQGAITPLSPALGFEVRTRNNVRHPIRMCSLYMRWNPQDGGK